MTNRQSADISGISVARATLRHRGRVRAAAVGVTTALLVALPLSACAIGGTTAADPSTSAGASTPAASTSEAPGGASGSRIDEATLKGSLLTLPGWTNKAATFCPAGEYQFTDGQAPNTRQMTVDIEDVAYVDIDADGDEETVAMLVCYIGQAGEYQVVAFDQNEAGTIETVGTVVTAKLMDEPDGSIVNMDGIRPDGNAVAVRVGDGYVCCGGNPDLINWQWRSYALSNGEFTQVSGEREFPKSK
ncbi:hypothetical protein J2S43_001365 [Catenuloplanes nepalensis]|uniref:Lipoprotein n=1 Tax=Catenuloplanes nepalensis TaxID=587533 RepID=A0ABT9MN82_9ACTN|nr:hypothetical protein [Catenuloplanes nepalensis]MDP9792853.1 hypothetical protein [Catenuloplanes nepalensis]